MSLRDKFSRYDGLQTILTGVDSGRSPAVLGRDQLAWAVNATTRGGFVTCRPGWAGVDLEFPDEDTETLFETGRFQGAWPYLKTVEGASTTVPQIVASIGGRIFLIDIPTLNVTDLSAQSGLTNVATQPHVWFVQAETYLVIQNGTDGALIYDGSTLRRSGYPGIAEVPPGSVMEYNNGRLWVASPDGSKFVAGDLVYSVTGTAADVLGFTENTYLNGGGFFAVPSQAGRIVAMRSVAVQDTPLGQGPLQVITTRGSFSVNAPFNRDEWQNTRSPIVTISMLASGGVSQASTTLVNGDIWFRAPDGVRSFVFAQRDHGTWVNTPLSREVSRAIDFDSPGLLDYASSALFDNRYLVTTQPSQVVVDGVVRGIAHKGLCVLDFAPVSQMFNRTQPVWEGVWTGLRILQVLTVDSLPSRAFIFALNSDNEIVLWEMSLTARFDGTETRIAWAFETPSYGFDTGGWNLRELRYSDLWMDRIAGDVGFTARYREDAYPFWRTWHQWETCAAYRDCDTGACEEAAQLHEQYRFRYRLPAASIECDLVTGKPSTQLYRVQLRLEIVGHCRVRQWRVIANDLPEDVEGGSTC